MGRAGRSVTASLPASSHGKGGRWSAILPNRWALLLVVPLLAMLLGFVVYPLVKLTIDSLTTGSGFGNYEAVLQSPAGRRALITTVLSSVLVSAISVMLGGLLAWHIRVAKSTVVKAVLWLAVLAPFWMGTVVKNYAIVILLSAEGPLDKLHELLGLAPVSLLYTSTAVALGMVYTMVPYAAFSLYGVFLSIDETLLDAARGLGASRARDYLGDAAACDARDRRERGTGVRDLYRTLLEDPRWSSALWLSVRIAVPVAVLAGLVVVPTLFTIHRSRLPFRNALQVGGIVGIILPISAYAVAMYGLYAQIGLLGTYWGLVLANLTLAVPVMLLVTSAAMSRIPVELELAAMVAGASRAQAWLAITLRLLSPAILAGGVLAFVSSLDEAVLINFLGGPGRRRCQRRSSTRCATASNR